MVPRWLIPMTLVTALVLCCEYRLTSLPLAEAEQGSDHGRRSRNEEKDFDRVQRRLHSLEKAPESVTVSFGAWQSEPPLDRFPPNDPSDRTRTNTAYCQMKPPSRQEERLTL